MQTINKQDNKAEVCSIPRNGFTTPYKYHDVTMGSNRQRLFDIFHIHCAHVNKVFV